MFVRERLLSCGKERIAHIFVFLCMFLVTEVGRRIYRPYIYANHVFDF